MINNINQSLFVFFVYGCKGCQYCPTRSVPLKVIKFLIVVVFVEFLIQLQFQDSLHTDAWCIYCSQCCKRSSWSGIFLSSPSPLYWLATQYFDECSKCKQSESFLSQPEHTIWVSRHRTFRTQYLHLGSFLWKQYVIPASYKTFASWKVFDYVLLYSH